MFFGTIESIMSEVLFTVVVLKVMEQLVKVPAYRITLLA